MLNHHQTVEKLLRDHFGDRQIVGIEIGTGAADLTRTILWAFPNCTLYTIDPWLHIDGREFEAGNPQEAHDQTRKVALERLRDFCNRVIVLPMTSREALSLVPKEVDFVWIDGDHSEDTVTFDCDHYGPLVKPGGILGGHDFGQVHPLTEIIMKKYDKNLNSGNDFTWWVFK